MFASFQKLNLLQFLFVSAKVTIWACNRSCEVQEKGNKTGVINDPLSQSHYIYITVNRGAIIFIWRFFVLLDLEKSRRTDVTCWVKIMNILPALTFGQPCGSIKLAEKNRKWNASLFHIFTSLHTELIHKADPQYQ